MRLAVLLLAACAGSEPEEEVLTGLSDEAGHDPLVEDHALLPWPSDFHLEADPSTVTGLHMALADEALPEGLSAATFAGHDGFTRIPAVLVALPGGFDASELPADPEASLSDGARLWLLDGDERVPVLAELDQNADDPDEQALIVRPLRVLAPATTHVVVLTTGLHRADGGDHPVSDAFRALRDGIATDSATVERWRERFEPVDQALDGLPVPRSEVLLAWSFTTRSEEQVTGPVLAMHDAMMQADLDFTITDDRIEGTDRLVEGTFTAPSFIGPDGRFDREDPTPVGTHQADFLLTIPQGLAQPMPVMLFGHGFFSSRYEPTWASLNEGLRQWGMAAATTTFVGFDEDSVLRAAQILGGPLDGIGELVDLQNQSQAHFTLLARLLDGPLGAAVLDGEAAVLDGGNPAYMGISNGGTQGMVIAATSPTIDRAALIVGGGGWTHFLQRAVQWNDLGLLIANRYDDPRDLQVALALVQQLFDPVDGMNFAPHLLDDRYPGRVPDPDILMVEAVGDCQVANLVTDWAARSVGLPLVTPAPHPVWGLEPASAEGPEGLDGRGALVLYDEHYPALPEGNVPPDDDNGAHESVRRLQAYRDQLGIFLNEGRIVNTCDGACDPE